MQHGTLGVAAAGRAEAAHSRPRSRPSIDHRDRLRLRSAARVVAASSRRRR